MCQIAECGGGGNERTSASMRTLKTAMLWDEGGTLIGILLIDLLAHRHSVQWMGQKTSKKFRTIDPLGHSHN